MMRLHQFRALAPPASRRLLQEFDEILHASRVAALDKYRWIGVR